MDTRRKITISVGFGLICGLVALIMVKTGGRIFNSQKLISITYTNSGTQPFLLALFQETANYEDEGTCLEGFELRSYKPGDKTPVSKVFISHKEDGVPGNVKFYCAKNGNAWIIEEKKFIQGDTGFLKKVMVDEKGNISEKNLTSIKGMSVKSYYSGNGLALLNSYNENVCLNMDNDSLTNGDCPWIDPVENKTNAFYFVKKTAQSTRGKLFLFKSNKPAPPQAMVVGFVTGDRPLPGISMFQDLSQSNYSITEERNDWYSKSDSLDGKIISLNEGAFLDSPKIIYQDHKLAIVTSGGPNEKDTKYLCFSVDGKKLWEVASPDTGKPNSYSPFQVITLKGETIIVNPESWAFCVDQTNGKIKWTLAP